MWKEGGALWVIFAKVTLACEFSSLCTVESLFIGVAPFKNEVCQHSFHRIRSPVVVSILSFGSAGPRIRNATLTTVSVGP